MRKFVITFMMFVGLSTAGAFFTATTAEAEVVDRIVARINDEIITMYDLEQAATPFLLQRGMNPSALEDEQRREEILSQVLDNLVERTLIVAEAKEMGLSVSERQIEQWMQRTRSQQGLSEEQFRQAIQQYGMSYDAYKDVVRQNLLRIQLVQQKLGSQVSVSEKEVNAAYQEEHGDDGQEKHITIRHILVQPQTNNEADVTAARKRAEEIKQQLADGADFENLAQAKSDGPSAKRGGLLGTFAKGELNPEFEQVAFQLDEGERSDVVRTEYGFHILRVDSIEEKASGDIEQRKQKIRQRLQQEAMQKQLDLYVENLRNEAYVEIKY